MSTHVIHFSGLINTVTTERIRDFCLSAVQQGASELRLHFASPGGQNSDAFSLYGFLRSLPVPLTTHNIGNVESTAVLIFLAGGRRLAAPHSRFLIHPMQWNFNVACQIDHARFREYLGILDNDLERYAQIFDERTKGAEQPLDIRRHLSGEEKVVAASASVTCGVAHEVAEAALSKDAVWWWVSTS